MDTLTPIQPVFDVTLSDAQVYSEGDFGQDESDLNSQCRLNDTYMDTSESEEETARFCDKIKELAVLHSITNLALVDLLSVIPRSAQRSKNSFAEIIYDI